MTAETPFIAPTSSDNFPALHVNAPHRRQRKNALAISFAIVTFILLAILISMTIWHSIRISSLQTEVKTLNRVLEHLQKQLGLNYIEDLNEFNEFEKEFNNALVGSDDDPLNDDDDDDDEDEQYSDYTELISKYNNLSEDDSDEEESVNNSNIPEDDNFYDDFEKFQDAKKKKQTRKLRSASQLNRGIRVYENFEPNSDSNSDHNSHNMNYEPMIKKTSVKRNILSESGESRRLRRPKIRKASGESFISAKSLGDLSRRRENMISSTPAAHFHLHHKIPHHHAAIKVDSFPGDMYIGNASWANEMNVERFFKSENGVLTVREAGLYYVYAQVCYNNTHDQNGFIIFHEHKPFLQCLNTIPTNLPVKIHTCHTSGLIYLKANETIHLRDFHSDRNAILRPNSNRSYFGLMRV